MLNLSPENLVYIFAGLFIGISLVIIIYKRKEKFPYFSRDNLLSPAELQFYKVLKAVCNERHDISCKVRLGDIINCTEYYWHKGYGPKISAKHIDFVLQHPDTSEIILCIELDDKSHNKPDRIARDKFVNKALDSANLPILHVPVTRGYDMAKLQKDIAVSIK